MDYYHLKENVWKAARVLYGEGEPEAAEWVEQLMKRLWRGWVPSTIQQLLQQQVMPEMNENHRTALQKLVTYLSNHSGFIAYARHRNAGRQIGSGAIESFCKQLFSMRMKGPGMFWGEEGAKALMTLRTLYLTDRWNLLWDQPIDPQPADSEKDAA